MNGQWDPLECETELVYGYTAGLNEASSMVLYLSDAGMSQPHHVAGSFQHPLFIASLHPLPGYPNMGSPGRGCNEVNPYMLEETLLPREGLE